VTLFHCVLDREAYAMRGVAVVRERADFCPTRGGGTGSEIPFVESGEAFDFRTIGDCDGHWDREPTVRYVDERFT
jgi:hypothetical protein